MCSYQFYKEEEKYYPRLYCKIKENTMNPYCVYSKRCDKEKKYILLDNSDNCIHMEEAKKLNIPKDAYYVRTYKQRANGTYSLYVDINGTRYYTMLHIKTNASSYKFNELYRKSKYKNE